MAFTKTRHYNKNPQRRKVPGIGAENELTRRQPPPVVSATPVASTLVIVFGVPVILRGIPQWQSSAGGFPNAAAISAGNTTVTLSYTQPQAGADIEVPFEDPGIRTNSGGYVPPQTITLP